MKPLAVSAAPVEGAGLAFLEAVRDCAAPLSSARLAAAVVVAREGEGVKLTYRAELAAYFHAAGLTAQALEAIRRKVRPGAVLTWVECEYGTGWFSLPVHRVAGAPPVVAMPADVRVFAAILGGA